MKISDLIPNLFNKTKYLLNTGTLRELQKRSLEPILNGRSVLISAPTGCGKTEAVLIPLFENIIEKDQKRDKYCSRVLYICPTKALINDLFNRFSWADEKLGIKIGRKTGDMNELISSRSPQVIITTPESIDVLISSPMDTHNDRHLKIMACLANIRIIVIDELHQFIGTSRGTQLEWLLSRLKTITKKDLQIIGMSATIPENNKILSFIQHYGSEAAELKTTEYRRELNFNLGKISSYEDLYQCVRMARDKFDAKKILIFANSRRECDEIFENIQNINEREKCYIHYSTLSFDEREDTEKEYKKRSGNAMCVATSTLELGIDIGDIDTVILFGAPNNLSSFIQKIGRGNRKKNIIQVIGLVRDFDDKFTSNNDLMIFFSLLRSYFLNQFDPAINVKNYSVAIQQIFSMTRQYEKFPLEKFYELNKIISPECSLSNEEISEIISSLVDLKYIHKPLSHINEYAMSEKTEFMIKKHKIYSNIGYESAGKLLFYRNKDNLVAEFPYKSNKDLVAVGNNILIGGKYYIIESTDISRGFGRVYIKEISKAGNVVKLKYESLMAPVSFSVSQNIHRAICDGADGRINIQNLLNNEINELGCKFSKLNFLDNIYFSVGDDQYCYYTFAGTSGNFLLSKIFYTESSFDEIRLLSKNKLEPINIDNNLIESVIAQNIYEIACMFSCSKFFLMLPERLQIKEIYSKFEPDLIKYLLNFNKMKFEKIGLPI